MSWNKKYLKCESCSTNEFEYKHKGLCEKCHPIRKKLEQLSNWNYNDCSTFVGIKQNTKLALSGQQTEAIKQTNTYIQNQYIERLNKIIVLSNLHLIDNELADIELEEFFIKTANKQGVRNNIFYGSYSLYSKQFNNDQIKFLIKQFLLIEVSKPLRIQEIKIGLYAETLSLILSPKI